MPGVFPGIFLDGFAKFKESIKEGENIHSGEVILARKSSPPV